MIRCGDSMQIAFANAERQIARLQLPSRMIVRQAGRILAPARLDRRCGRQSFQAIAMIRAVTGKRVALEIVRHSHVAQLRMRAAVQQAAVGHRSAADSAANCEVQERIQPLRRAPAAFGERRGIDVGVECHRDVQGSSDGSREIEISPGQLGRPGDEAKCRRQGIEVNWAERGDPDRAHRSPGFEKLQHSANGVLRRRGGDLRQLQLVRRVAHRANKLRTARFDSAQG